MKIYVASSWRNIHQPTVVNELWAAGHEVYDFRNPSEGNKGFAWSDIDPCWQRWRPEVYRLALDHPLARKGFALDMDALRWCDGCVLVMPSGRSAALEAGWAAGAGKRTCIYVPEPMEPELMVKMLGEMVLSPAELVAWANRA